MACGPFDKQASEEEIQDQIQLLRQSMDDGAIGMSRYEIHLNLIGIFQTCADQHCSGLTYTPGMYASDSELSKLCRILAEEYPGAYYAPHHRSYGRRAIESYGEMLDLGRSTGCPIRELYC